MAVVTVVAAFAVISVIALVAAAIGVKKRTVAAVVASTVVGE